MYTKTTYYLGRYHDYNHVFLEFIPEYEKGEDKNYLQRVLPDVIELTDNCFNVDGKTVVVGGNKKISRLIKYRKYISVYKKLKLGPPKLTYIIEYTSLPDMIGKIVNGEVIIKQGEMDKYGITLLNDHIAFPNTLNPYI